MITDPVLAMLLFDFLLFLASAFLFDKSPQRWESLLVSALFFCSGMPALIYQVVWQRVLFLIYGVNAESVAVVVSAFMLGLGLGSLAGGWLSSRYSRRGIFFFGLAELGIAGFGLCSIHIFHWAAAYTAGANLFSVVIFSLLLLLIPTMLMGATLPLLVGHLVRSSGRVGLSVSRLYFVNTFGSAVACFLCAKFLMRDYGESGSVNIAACFNILVGATAFLYASSRTLKSVETSQPLTEIPSSAPPLPLSIAMLLAGFSGFIALGFEISWFRVFSIASADRAPAFALLLATYLAGIAAGSFLSERFTQGISPSSTLRVIGVLLLLAGALSVYLPPIVAALMARKLPYLSSTPLFFLTAAMLGSVLPLLCQVSVPANAQAGRGVSLIYVTNILGSVLGSLGIGFVLMQYFGLRQISLQLGLAALLMGALVLFFSRSHFSLPPAWSLCLLAAALAAIAFAPGRYGLLYEKLIFGAKPEARIHFAHLVENRNGVIAITREGEVFGAGVYDGYFKIDPAHDSNAIVRAFFVSAMRSAPKRVLMIGLASGSWAQVLANQPQVETVDIVEINPGYLQLIPQFPVVRTLLRNSKVHIYIDDGRRWLLAHPDSRYDAIVTNNTYHWRDHSTNLLSADFLRLVHPHLNPGGIYVFNTTDSFETIATALNIYPYALRFINCVAVSDSPIIVDKDQWLQILRAYRIDDHLVFDPANPSTETVFSKYIALADSVNEKPKYYGLESTDTMRPRLLHARRITDDNMGGEWDRDVYMPWRDVAAPD